MKAVSYTHYGSPDVIKLVDIKKPLPKDDQVLVKVYATSITTADSMIREGKPWYGRLFLGLARHKKPIAGTGFSGVIQAIGNNVRLFNIGDEVFGETGLNFSANAEYLCISEHDVITTLTKNMSFAEAAPICDGALTSYAFLKDIGQLSQGQRILINGAAGSLGSAAVQLARHLGAEVSAVCSTTNISLVKSLGADHIIDYLKDDFTQLQQRYDIIYDAVGKSSYAKCKKILMPNGSYLSPVLSFTLLLHMLGTTKSSGKKARFSATGLRPTTELQHLLNELKPLFEGNKIKSVIDRQYTLEQTAEAHRYIDTGHKKGNVVAII